MKYRKTYFSYITLFFILFTANAFCESRYDQAVKYIRKSGLNLVSAHKTESDKLLIYIQDAHCNYPAQKELSSMMGKLYTGNYFDFVAVEGSSGEIDTSLISSYPIDSTRHKMADNLLNNGVISGEEYFSIYSGKTLKISGVDDKKLYLKNIQIFSQYFDISERCLPVMNKIDSELKNLKKKHYNRILTEFEKIYAQYCDANIGLDKFIDETAKLYGKSSLLLEKYPAIKKVCAILKTQHEFDSRQLSIQTKEIIDKISDNAAPEKTIEIKKLVLANISGKIDNLEFYEKLLKTFDETNQNQRNYPVIEQYITLLKDIRNIHNADVNKESDSFAADIYIDLAKSDTEKKLYNLSKLYFELEKLCRLSLTRAEYNSLINSSNDIAVLFASGFNSVATVNLSEQEISLIEKLARNNMSFYSIAGQRDEVIFKNSLAMMKAEKAKSVLLIAGGFHTEAIVNSCIRNNINCIVLSPRMVGKNDFSKYASVLLRSKEQSQTVNTVNSSLRASSFFANHSFDSIKRINEFRNQFVFGAVMDSLKDFTYAEVYSIIRDWREGYIEAVSQKHKEGSPEFVNAITMFDYAITDMFSFENIKIDRANKTIVLKVFGEIVQLSRKPGTGVRIKALSARTYQDYLEDILKLNKNKLELRNTDVYISSWTIADENSPYLGHGDAHYSVKYIEALNKRGITPLVILPTDQQQLNRTLKKYSSAVKGKTLNFKFVKFDRGNKFIEVDFNGTAKREIIPDLSRKPAILHLYSKIDPQADERIALFNMWFTTQSGGKTTPFFIKIPTAGTIAGPWRSLDEISVYFNPMPADFAKPNVVEAGFVIDGELLTLINRLKTTGRHKFRQDIIEDLNIISENKLADAINSIEGIEPLDFTTYNWSFRYLTEKSDAELASFMKAVSLSTEPQVIFTFYSDKSQTDKHHKQFLKKNFNFIDLQQANNDNLSGASKIVVINLPSIDSMLFKSLMSVSDAAVVSGENSLVEGIVLNKLGFGPAILFKPAMKDHFSIVENAMKAKGRIAVLEKIRNYCELSSEKDSDYFSSFQIGEELNGVEQFIHDTLFDPNTNTLMRSSMADIVMPQNGLNILTDIIGDLDNKVSKPDIIARYSFPVKQSALELVNIFMMSKTFDPKSKSSQQEFLNKFVKSFVKRYILSSTQSMVEPEQILSRLAEFSRLLVANYKEKLEQTGVSDATHLADNLKKITDTFFASIEIAGTGHLFIPSQTESAIEHYYCDWQPFVSVIKNYSSPSIKVEKLTVEERDKLVGEIKEAQYVKSIFQFMDLSDVFALWSTRRKTSGRDKTISDYETIIPFYTRTPRQTEFLLDSISFVTIDSMKNIAKKYSSKLIELYGSSDLKSLYEYCKYLHGKNPAGFTNTEIYSDFDALKRELMFESFDMYTRFFRHESGWKKEIEDYLSDLIACKIAEGDYSISVKSIGAATGKEPYSIAAIIEKALYKTAKEKIFAGVSNAKEKENMIQEWISRWNVNIYAIDHVLSRFVIIRNGIYTLSPDEQMFFDLNKEYMDMFSDTAKDKESECVIIKDRLRRWVKPVYCDIGKDAPVISNLKSEIVFAMNVFPYLKNARERVYDSVMSSLNPQYKGFMAFNINFDPQLEQLNMINGQPLCLPAKIQPSASAVIGVAISQGIDDAETLARIFGVDNDFIHEILNSRTEVESFSDPDSKIYKVIVQETVENFMDETALKLSSPLSQVWFVKEKFRALVIDTAMKLNRLGVNAEFIQPHINALKMQVENIYVANLEKLNQSKGGTVSKSFIEILNIFFSQITVAPDGSLFIESEFMGTPLFEHIYTDRNEFGIRLETEGKPQVKTEYVTPGVKLRLIETMSEIRYIREILDEIKFDIGPIASRGIDLAPYYNGSAAQKNILDEGVAFAVLDKFHQLVNKNQDKLKTTYGSASIGTLRTYFRDISKKRVPYDSVVMDGIKEIIRILKDTQNAEIEVKNGATQIFRDHVTDWVEGLETYLYDLITQKTISGDLTLNLRSVASSIGKEAYTLSAITEKMLLKYAHDVVFADVSNPKEKNALAERWVDTWDIKIYAIDMNLLRLAQSHIGIYKLFDHNLEWYYPSKHREYLRMFSDTFKTDLMTIVKVNDRYKRWLIPVYCNFTSDLSPVLSRPSEVTFGRYIFMYLPKDAQDNLVNGILRSSNPNYKSFIGFNESSRFKPYLKNIFEAHAIVEPNHEPDIDTLVKYAVNTGFYSLDKIASLVGINSDKLKGILISDTENLPLPEGIYKNQCEKIIKEASKEFSKFVSDDSHIEFINNFMPDRLQDLALNLHMLGVDSKNIMRQLSLFIKDTGTAYRNMLIEAGIADSTVIYEAFMNKLWTYFNSITFENGHMFMPESISERNRYIHAYMDFGYFSADKEKYGDPQIKKEILPSRAKERIVADIIDSEQIFQFLRSIQFELDYTKFTSSDVPPTYIKTIPQKETLIRDTAFIFLDYFRQMTLKYSGQIKEIYGEANVANLIAYFNDSQKKKVPDNSGIKDDFIKLFNILLNNQNKNIFNENSTTIGLTAIFRDADKGWVSSLEQYLFDVIDQKVMTDDLSLTLRSIGSSIGKEAYTMAFVTEKVLRKYAVSKLFKDITDEQQKNILADKWIDNWDIRVLAMDLSIHRLAYAREGVFLVKRHEMQFLEVEPDFKPMFSQIIPKGSPMMKFEFIAEANPRIKRWIQPVYCNLDDDISPLINNPAEISFAMTMLMYLKDKQNAVKTIIDSTNPDYKGFFGYNENAIVDEAFNAIDYKPVAKHIISPSKIPDLSFIFKMMNRNDIFSLKKLSELTGIAETRLKAILTDMETPATEKTNFYSDYAKELIDTFYNESQTRFAQPQEQADFINTKYLDFMIGFVFQFAILKTDARVIYNELERFNKELTDAYLKKLRNLNIAQYGEMSKKFEYNLNLFMASVEIAGFGDLFFPYKYKDRILYRHYYIDNRAFDFDRHNRMNPVFAVENLPAEVKIQKLNDVNDARYVRDLLDYLDFESYLNYFAKFKLAKELPDTYDGSQPQIEAMKDKIAVIALFNFRQMVSMFRETLIAKYGRADIRNLHDYIKRLIEDKSTEDFEIVNYFYGKVLSGMDNLHNKFPTGITGFFRMDEAWLKHLQNYVDDVIMQKTAAGDFTFTLRSIGCAIGKEAYSIAGVVEQRLKRYAREKVYVQISDKNEQEKLVQMWVDSWKVKVYAIDVVLPRLATAYEGKYSLMADELDVLKAHPELRDMFARIDKVNELEYNVTVNQRLRSWIVPVLCDLNEDLSPIRSTISEITFSMNLFPYLDFSENVYQNILLSQNPKYKTYYAYNEVFNTAPSKHYFFNQQNLMNSQPHVIPPSVYPDASLIESVAQRENIDSIEKLSAIFGMPVNQIQTIMNVGLDIQSTREKIDRRRSARELVDSMI